MGSGNRRDQEQCCCSWSDETSGAPSPAPAPFLLEEGISHVLSRWPALQMAVDNEWGGRDSRRKMEELSSSLLSWFSQPEVRLSIDDLEHMLDEKMALSFNTVIEDGSIEEIAEQLMIVHEDCLHSNEHEFNPKRCSNPDF